jgi:fructose-specific component phosphotransferase system IIB-like protein
MPVDTGRNPRDVVVLNDEKDKFMKTKFFYRAISSLAVAAFLSVNALAQDAASTSAPKLSYGVPAVLQLTQAKVGDDTIVAYIQNSPTIYTLDASEIIYLKQQGVSSAVLNAMLNQRNRLGDTTTTATASTPVSTGANSAVATTSATAGSDQVVGDASTAIAQPTVTYAQAPSTVYVAPDSPTYVYDSGFYSPYYYGYGWGYPGVSLSFGWGGRFGGGWHGYHGGGFHGGGGGFHGGGSHGGFHH